MQPLRGKVTDADFHCGYQAYELKSVVLFGVTLDVVIAGARLLEQGGKKPHASP